MRLPVFIALMLCLIMSSSHAQAPRISEEFAQSLTFEARTITFKTKQGQKIEVQAEIASSPIQLQVGLMYRRFMAADHGMLFIFPQEQPQIGFWMRNTYIPLDMVFINQDGRITHIHEHAKPHDETIIKSTTPTRAVLELNAGAAKKLGLHVGSHLLQRPDDTHPPL